MKRIIIDIHDDYADLATFTFVGLGGKATKVTTIAANIREDDYFVVAGDGKITALNTLAPKAPELK